MTALHRWAPFFLGEVTDDAENFVLDLVFSIRQVYVDVQEKHPTPFASLIGIVFPFVHGVILTGREGAFQILHRLHLSKAPHCGFLGVSRLPSPGAQTLAHFVWFLSEPTAQAGALGDSSNASRDPGLGVSLAIPWLSLGMPLGQVSHMPGYCRCDSLDRCPHYVPSRTQRLQTASLALVDPNAPLSETKKRAIAAVVGAFSHEVLMSLCQVLMTQYFVLTNEDHEQWAEEPEEYAFEEVGRHPRRHLHSLPVSLQSVSSSPLRLPM